MHLIALHEVGSGNLMGVECEMDKVPGMALYPGGSLARGHFIQQWSSLHFFSFHEMLFPLLVPGLFFLSFMVLAMYRVHSSMCMQEQMKEG